jgi:hypothetical protein
VAAALESIIARHRRDLPFNGVFDSQHLHEKAVEFEQGLSQLLLRSIEKFRSLFD